MGKEAVIHEHGRILPTHGKNKTLPSVTMWMDLEGFMLSEVLDRERQIVYDFTYMWNLKNTASKQKWKQTHRFREGAGGRLRGEAGAMSDMGDRSEA